MERQRDTGRDPEVLDPEELAAISRSAVARSYPERTVIVTEGDASDSLFVILEGRCRAYVSDENGREAILSDMGPGEYFGEVAMDEGPRSASVVTLEPTKLLVVPADRFRAFLAENPDFAFHFILKLLHRIRELTHNVSGLALLDAYGRVARLLRESARDEEGRQVVAERMTQTEIASRVGCSREMVTRQLKDLQEGGYLSARRGGEIVLLKALPPRW